jgi:hydroxymethylbilane synthase
MPKTLLLGTRGSLLATLQSQWVADQLIGTEIELKIIKTAGDDLSISLMKPDEPGAFVNALRSALIAGEVDFIVHSLKDLPSAPHPELTLGAIPVREDHRDILISKNNVPLDAIEIGGIIGTSSPRRMAALKARNPQLVASPIRGNIDLRIKKVRDGQYAAAILAAAGLNRIGRSAEIAQYFDVADILPAPAQGALGIECRSNDLAMINLLSKIDHALTRLTSTAERAVLRGLNAGCDLAVGAYAQFENGRLVLQAELGNLESGISQKITESVGLTSVNGFEVAENLGLDVARRFVR